MPTIPKKAKTGLASKLESQGARKPGERRREPLWKGPEVDGISYSMLSTFLVCRERFRVKYIEGLDVPERFYAPIDYGHMWHTCEEALGGNRDWKLALKLYGSALCTKHRLQQEQVEHWYQMCLATFPLYVDYWKAHPDVVDRTPLFQEKVFDVSYKLPSGRIVRLRGKQDGGDIIGTGRGAKVFLQENKTKSSIDGLKITRQLKFDLQTMLYTVAHVCGEDEYECPFGGVRYNVVRRSAHKSVESMLKKLEEDRAAGRIGEWFARWKVEISEADIAKFRSECLDPILENVCGWYDTLTNPHRLQEFVSPPLHWRHPFGVYNVLDEGGSSDLDEYLDTGSEVGLERREKLFEELG